MTAALHLPDSLPGAPPAAAPTEPAVVLRDPEVNALSSLLLAAMGALAAYQDDPDAVEAVELLGLVRQDLQCRQRAAREQLWTVPSLRVVATQGRPRHPTPVPDSAAIATPEGR